MIFSAGEGVRETRRAVDELAIRNVVALAARYADDGTLADYGALFTSDARWEMTGVPVRDGRQAIVAAGAERRAAGIAGPGSKTRHLVSTVSVDVAVDGDHAVAESYWQFYVATDATPALQSMGHYRDTFVRTGEVWQIRHRRITLG